MRFEIIRRVIVPHPRFKPAYSATPYLIKRLVKKNIISDLKIKAAQYAESWKYNA